MDTTERFSNELLGLAFERLSRERGWENRPGQREMARLWSETLEEGGMLLVEAPTGIGKSLAYLLPALLRRARGSGPVVVSTCTKALQEQLLRQGIPLARREALRADIVLVNHALLLSDPGLRATLIAEAGALVLDEAHHVERVAREQLGVTLGVQDFLRLAGRTDARTGVLRILKRALRRGRGGRVAERIRASEASIAPVLAHAAA